MVWPRVVVGRNGVVLIGLGVAIVALGGVDGSEVWDDCPGVEIKGEVSVPKSFSGWL